MNKLIAATAAFSLLATSALAQQHRHDGSAPLAEPGQGAFAAIQEVVAHMSADPATDWSRVDIERLRQHLIDMDEVTVRARIESEEVTGGVRYRVTGEGRTREAIQRMVMAHARAMGDAPHWTLEAEQTADGAIVVARPKAPGDLVRIRALGLVGMMSDGAHHQQHHLMLATGEEPHH